MAPALHVTHLLAFTLTDVAPSMRIVRLSNGPTLSFRVERYSLVKDIVASSRHAKHLSAIESLTAPLSLFPPLAPHKLALSSARRVILVAYNPDRGTVDWRHFRIIVKPYGVSRRLRRVLQGAAGTAAAERSGSGSGAVLDLGNERDVADYVLRARGARSGSASVDGGGGGGYETATSEVSSVAEEDGEAENVVSLADDYVGRNNRKGEKRAVRLDEIGPRMELRLVKITDGVPGKEGQVIYHEFVKKTKAEIAAQRASHSAKEKLRKERREEQERNVRRKAALTGKTKADAAGEIGEEGTDDDDDGEDDRSSQGPSGEEDGGEAFWDEEEEISDGEVSEDRSSEDAADEDDDEDRPFRKKAKVKK
ncbi:Brix domain-containing protein [Russula compacta]|nr:Brix domain-containing protein [Russula compacta]